jgi:glycine betaine/proline transport system substrate-binding protein
MIKKQEARLKNSKRRTHFITAIIALILAQGSIFTGSGAIAAESSDPIKLTLNDWTGQHITTTIMGKVLEKNGYNVEYVKADYIAQFAGLRSGDLHVAMEIWETTAKQLMADVVATGKVANMGKTGMQAIEEWWYPLYMKDVCPGLPDWKALKACAGKFSTAETAPNGRYVGGPVGWAGFDDERVEALDLNFEVIHPGTEGTMLAELESAYQRKAPIILWVYVPHWVTAKYEGEFVEFPKYTDECYSDPSWGINPDMAYDCGKPTGPIWKIAWAPMKDKWPGAYKIVQNYQLSNDEMASLVVAVDLDGKDLNLVVDEWIEKNADRWKNW